MAGAETIELSREAPFRLGGALVSPATRELQAGGRTVVLEPRVMQVLTCFSRRAGEVLTRDDLTTACWDGRVVGEDAINRVISKIHRLSELPGAAFTLETIRGVGYRLTVEPPGPEPSPPDHREPASAHETATAGVPPGSPNDAPSSATPSRRRPVVWAAATAVLVATAAAVLLIASPWRREPAPASAAADRPLTLAVLPFENLTGVESNAFMARSMAREVRNRVAQLRGMSVIADSSSFAVAAQPLTAVEAGRRLGADLLLDGSLRLDGDDLRITAELVDAKTGLQVWQDDVTRPLAEQFAAQEAVSAVVIRELLRRLGPDRLQVIAPPRPRDRAAYNLARRAEQEWERLMTLSQQGRQAEALAAGDRAEALALEALAIDPDEPVALLMISRLRNASLTTTVANGDPQTVKKLREETADFALRALANNPDDPFALVSLAENYRRYQWRWREAEPLFQRALALNPNFADGHTWYTYLLSHTGRCREALVHARTAARLDPEFLWRQLAIPRVLYCLNEREEAFRLYDGYMARDPQNVFLQREVYLKRMMERDPAALRALARRVRALWPGGPPPVVQESIQRMEAGADALEGRPEALLQIVDRDSERPAEFRVSSMGRRDPDALWTFAMEYAAAGRTETAVAILEAAVAAGSVYIPETLPYGATEFTPAVRAHPRYQALWRDDPRLAELKSMRRESLSRGQMSAPPPP